MYKDIQLRFVTFDDTPHIDERSTSCNYTTEMNKDIADYPYMVMKDVAFEIRFVFKNKHELVLTDTIPNGFTYNMADIPFLLQPISYDKHSPYVRDASLIHDYLLKYKKELFNMWQLKDYGMNHRDFRILTSDVFKYILLQSGVPKRKATKMRNAVDLFQKFCVWSWFGVK